MQSGWNSQYSFHPLIISYAVNHEHTNKKKTFQLRLVFCVCVCAPANFWHAEEWEQKMNIKLSILNANVTQQTQWTTTTTAEIHLVEHLTNSSVPLIWTLIVMENWFEQQSLVLNKFDHFSFIRGSSAFFQTFFFCRRYSFTIFLRFIWMEIMLKILTL